MKRFFGRFSTPANVPPGGAGGATDYSSASKGSSSARSASSSAGDRVRALAAKYEGLASPSGTDEGSPTVTLPKKVRSSLPPPTSQQPGSAGALRSTSAESPHVTSHHHHHLASPEPAFESAPSSVPSSPSTPFPPVDRSSDGHRRSGEASRRSIDGRSTEGHGYGGRSSDGHSLGLGSAPPFQRRLSGPVERRGREASRDVSGSSAGTTSAVKSVAFAPSPKKAQRPSSPSARSAGHDDNASAVSLSNFAKPTLASAARARSISKTNATDASSAAPGTALLSTSLPRGSGGGDMERGMAALHANRPASGSSGAPAPRSRRSNSTSAPNRRGAPGLAVSSPSEAHNGASFASSPAAPASAANGPARAAGEAFSPSSSSIPFASPQLSQGRSSSPLSFATASSLPGAGESRAGSRRASGVPGLFANASVGPTPGTKGIGAPSWSEMTEGDLVSNLGPRERTRQEVLWEIVASEERYVAEMEKAKELYLDALLHPHRFSPPSSPQLSPPSTGMASQESPGARSRASLATGEAQGSSADLPIAARFMSSLSGPGSGGGGASSSDGHGDAVAQASARAQHEAGARSPYAHGLGNAAAPNTAPQSRRTSMQSARPGAARSQLAQGLGMGLPRTASGKAPPPAAASREASQGSAKSRWSTSRKASGTSGLGSQAGYTTADGLGLSVQLPASLRCVLEAVNDGLLEGHALLSEALKARYEEQWPLVRSLADVFLKHQYILKHYALYVCHLERALEQLEEALLMERAMRGKRIKKERLTQAVGLGRAVASLEAMAQERGECGLSIFLSMPFQRLLKYPLLFQNLLFHTDPSTYEFESTVGMVVDVEHIVRSIEDEKVSSEERDKVLDAFARIDGISDRQLLKPRADRLLIEERALYDEGPRRALSESAPKDGRLSSSSDREAGAPGFSELAHNGGGAPGSASKATSPSLRSAIKSKRSYRRLSDFLSTDDKATKAPSMGSKRDMWIIRFSDVELRCQRVGVTALPMGSSASLTAAADGTLQHDPNGNAATDEATAAATDFAHRSKDSKERLKALRNTTLRAKTRNLYKFIGVNAWRKAQSAGVSDAEDADGLPTNHEVDEEDEDMDETSSMASEETEAGVLVDFPRYVRQSKLSFIYTNGDTITPNVVSKPAPPRAANASPHQSSVAAFRSSRSAGAGAATPLSAAASPVARTESPKPLPRSATGPVVASSATTQAVVSASHAKPKRDKFGARLRTEAATPASSPTLASASAAPPSAPVPRRPISRATIVASTNDGRAPPGRSTDAPQQRAQRATMESSLSSDLRLVAALMD